MGLCLDIDTGQRVFIGENIIIYVNGRKGRKTRIVIEAPKELYIKRGPDIKNGFHLDQDEEIEIVKL